MDTREKLLQTKKQHAEIWKCNASDFDLDENVFIETEAPFFEVLTFGSNAVIRADKSIIEWCREQFSQIPARVIMDDHLFMIETKLREFGKKLAGEHVRYLHLFPEIRVKKPSGLTFEWYKEEKIKELYQHKEFGNALSFNDSDRITVAAYSDCKIVGMAGCDNYLDSLWQIGIDVLPEYRFCKLGSYLVKELALEIERNGKVAYYNTWSPNLASTRLALGVGFRPVWVKYFSEDI